MPFTKIPTELKLLTQWVCWRQETVSGKPTKVPYGPKSGCRASTTNHENWATHPEAIDALETGKGFNGVGFVFTEVDPYMGVDLDDCISEGGSLKAWAKAIVKHLDSYTEKSVSGRGVHIILRAKKPGGRCRTVMAEGGHIEFYDKARYFCTTGEVMEGRSTIEERQAELNDLYGSLFKEPERPPEKPSAASSGLPADEALERAFAAENGDKVRRLYEGDFSEYPSRSEADIALCCHLAFWFGRDPQAIDGAFRGSGLMREKWDEKRGDKTYGNQTIKKAIKLSTDTYTPAKKREEPPPPVEGKDTPDADRECPYPDNLPSPTLEELRNLITANLGEGVYKAVVACMSTAASLLLADNQNPPSLNLVGPPASMKTTVLRFFYSIPEISYKTDSFTPASFVSHSSNIKAEKLEEIDLLPRIRHKVMVVPELAPIFGKNPDQLLENFSILVRVFDGQGLETDSGARGRRGYGGDYLFAWLGATTPVPNKVWRVMGKLGSRFLFYQMPVEADSEVQIERLTDSLLNEDSFYERVELCASKVRLFLAGFWDRHGGVRGVTWDRKKDNPTVTKYIVRLAQFVAIARSEVNVWTESGTKEYNFNQPIIEQPERLATLLVNLARAHALLHGRDGVTGLDMPLVTKVALSSMPDDRRGAIEILFRDTETPEGQAKSAEVEKHLKVSRPTARTIMKRLSVLGLVDLHEEASPEGNNITLKEQFHWFLSDEFNDLCSI